MTRIFLLMMAVLINLTTFSQSKLIKNVDKVLNQLNIKSKDCYFDLVIEKSIPYLFDRSVLVIPKIIEEGEGFKSFDSYILIIDDLSGTIISKFYEPNGWTSDALMITSINIDFAPYNLSKTIRAFGIRLSYRGSSNVFQFSSEDISLFVQQDSLLFRVLSNYQISSYHGEQDFDCKSSHIEENKILIISDSLTNGYYNIIVKNKINNIKHLLVNNDCKYVDSVFVKKEVLRFDKEKYKWK